MKKKDMMKIEEAAKDYAKGKSSSEVFRRTHEEDSKAGVEFAEQHYQSENAELVECLKTMTALCELKYGNLDSDVSKEIEKSKQLLTGGGKKVSFEWSKNYHIYNFDHILTLPDGTTVDLTKPLEVSDANMYNW
ncbi:MAG: hypothetical protein ACKO96_08360, partial [Flammeovirgaceae bacterium]